MHPLVAKTTTSLKKISFQSTGRASRRDQLCRFSSPWSAVGYGSLGAQGQILPLGRTHTQHVNDWRLAKKSARYLKGTIDPKLAMSATDGNLNKDNVRVVAHSDADYTGDRVHRKAVTGRC
ncbi:Copia protein [Phytophthora megakarya]|uniref:Copia protein n=1 Tax=Phytophthora megakarya TaxID=4795 RepID=A0A225WVC7_9STRA|nr:Copia protein [Phytophthora megakarya]